MRFAARSTALLALAAALAGQNPAVDQPSRRAVLHPGLGARPIAATCADAEVAGLLAQGFALWQRGHDWQAWRSFREVVHRDDHGTLGWLGLALVSMDVAPRRAVESAWAAFTRRERAAGFERALVEAVAEALDATARPDRTDPRFDVPLSADARRDLAAVLRRLAVAEPEHVVIGDVAARVATPARRWLDPDDPDERGVLDAWLAKPLTMPFTIRGLDAGLWRRVQRLDAAGDRDAAVGAAVAAARWPRHPRFPTPGITACEAALGRLLGDGEPSAGTGAGIWSPPPAPPLDVVRGLGGRRSLDDLAGRPVLVVFFLGFGCVHCVEQLHALLPAVEAFRGNGIEILAVGTDDAAQVKASYQMARENGTPPMPFDILCDPAATSFRDWGAFDEFADEPLHGTFFVDAQRRVLWGDVSVEPFMATAFLLTECKRLLAAWD